MHITTVLKHRQIPSTADADVMEGAQEIPSTADADVREGARCRRG